MDFSDNIQHPEYKFYYVVYRNVLKNLTVNIYFTYGLIYGGNFFLYIKENTKFRCQVTILNVIFKKTEYKYI